MPACRPGSKKSAKRVKDCSGDYVCVRYGDRSMTIKKHNPARKRSFCARHKCATKTNPATAGYQSCKAWSCKTGSRCGGSRERTRRTKRKSMRRRSRERTKPKRKSTRRRSRSGTRGTRRSSRNHKHRSKSRGKYSRCWSGYRRSGWKTKNGRRVPNCVKI